MPTVLITGASRGLGLEFCRQYAVEGWQVIAVCRRPAEAAELARLGVRVEAADVADPVSVQDLARRLAGQPIDVLINNAGVFGGRQSLGDVDLADWQQVLAVNCLGPYVMAEAFLPHLEAGGRKLLANVTSQMGSIADNSSGGYYAYRSSKAALNAVVKSLSIDLRPRGIAAILLHPGWVQTDMGGPGAPLTPPESVRGMRAVIDGAGMAQSGRFLGYDGQDIPW